MDIQRIKELALANGFKLKEQASGNMDLNAYVYDFANAIEREAKAQAVPGWISVEDGLPPCDFEFCETGERVSNAVLIHSAATYGFNMGMGHVNEDGVWNVYSGEHDFMNVLMVTHWMPLPELPVKECE